MEAEKRALRRGLLAIRVVKKMTREQGINDYNGLQVELVFMRNAMCDMATGQGSELAGGRAHGTTVSRCRGGH